MTRARRGVPPRAGDQRLRVVRLPLRQEARPAGAQHRQHADHQPLRARRRDSRRRSRRASRWPRRSSRPSCRTATTTSSRPSSSRRCARSAPGCIPPILRDARARRRSRSVGEHVLVYQTSDTFHELVPTLQRLPGGSSSTGSSATRSSATSRSRASPRTASCAIWRRRARCSPAAASRSWARRSTSASRMLSVPLEGQFEQTLNALYLQKLGYGEYHRELSEAAIAQFLERAPEYARNAGAHDRIATARSWQSSMR